MLNSKFWARYFEVYDVLNLLIPYQRLLEIICDELDVQKGEKVLEAGCGTGNLALKIKERGAEVIGLDNCQEALNIYQKKDPDAKLVLADLRKKLPFLNNSFDKITLNNTLYALSREKQLETLKELYRILKPAGKIIIVNPKKNAKILPIYFLYIKESFKKKGFRKSINNFIILLPQTVKMIYFNSLIKREVEKGAYNFLAPIEQKVLLQKMGFIKITETKFVYADQNILNIGFKK